MTIDLLAAFAAVLGTAATAGAVVAVASRSPRLAILGLLVALLAAPFVADPLPDLRGVAARIAGAGLAVYPLLMAVRGSTQSTSGSRSGWPADALLALTAAAAAWAAAATWGGAGQLGPADVSGGLDAPGAGAVEAALFLPAIAAGAAVLALATAPVAFARDPLRLTIGLSLAIVGLTLVQVGLSGPPTAFTDLCVALLLATIGGGGALLTRAARRTGVAAVRVTGGAAIDHLGEPPAAARGPAR